MYLMIGSLGSAVIAIFFMSYTLLAYRARRNARQIRRQRSFLQALVDFDAFKGLIQKAEGFFDWHL